MVHIYEKIPSAYDNEHGIEEVDDKNVFKDGPCVITILAKTWLLSSVNGAMKLTSSLINQDVDTVYNPKRRVFCLAFGSVNPFPFSIWDSAFTEDEPTNEELDEFVDTYFLPLVSENNNRIDTVEAMKNLRNINFVTYCNGSIIYREIETLLVHKMKALGYADEEINSIISQCCFASITGDTFNSVNATTMFVTDKNDTVDEKLEESLVKCNNYYRLILDGNGKHDLKKYMRDDPKFSLAIKEFLNQSLDNANSNVFAPINPETFVPDVVESYKQKLNSDIEYSTYRFKNDWKKNDYIYKVYRSYKEGDSRIDFRNIAEKLELYQNSSEIIKPNNAFLEVAYKGDEVIAFCMHGMNMIGEYEINLLVCSPSFRNNGIGTHLYNNALTNMSQKGFDSCILESAKSLDNYTFWEHKGATQIRTRYMEDFIGYTEISIMQLSNIKDYLDSLNSDSMKLERKQENSTN